MKQFSNILIALLSLTIASCANVHNAMTALTAPVVTNQNARFLVLTNKGSPFMQIAYSDARSCTNDLNSGYAQIAKTGAEVTCSSISFSQMLNQKADLIHIMTNQKSSAAFLNYDACNLFRNNIAKASPQYSVECE